MKKRSRGSEALVSGSDQGLDGVNELRAIAELVEASGYDDGRVRIDTSVVRGLEYYTGPVYEVELTFEIEDEKGRPIRFGSVGGGGRYEGGVALKRSTRAGNRLFHRRLAFAGGAHRARQDKF